VPDAGIHVAAETVRPREERPIDRLAIEREITEEAENEERRRQR
jgi:hypothetical protein